MWLASILMRRFVVFRLIVGRGLIGVVGVGRGLVGVVVVDRRLIGVVAVSRMTGGIGVVCRPAGVFVSCSNSEWRAMRKQLCLVALIAPLAFGGPASAAGLFKRGSMPNSSAAGGIIGRK